MSRPVTLTIAVVLQWVAAVITLLAGLDLFMSALRISTEKTELALENAGRLNGITDVSGAQIVAGVLTAGIFLIAIAIVRIILALYLGRGRNWARMVITVVVLLNALSAIAYLFQEEFWRGLPALALEAVILWLMFNRSSSEFIAQQSGSTRAVQTL